MTEPEWADAWLLEALARGQGDPTEIIAYADGINKAIPLHSEWIHACIVLGERGLLIPGDPFPTVSPAGIHLLETAKDQIQHLKTLPITADPLPPPTPEACKKGYEGHHKRMAKWFKNYKDQSARKHPD